MGRAREAGTECQDAEKGTERRVPGALPVRAARGETLRRVAGLAVLYLVMTLLSALRPSQPAWRLDRYQWGPPRLIVQSTAEGVRLNVPNQVNILRQSAINIVLGCGLTLVIITAGIDLSVGSVLALANVAFVWAARATGNLWAGIPAALAAGTFCGLVCGALTVRGRVPSFITTLGMLMVARGLAHVWSGGQTIYLPTPRLAVSLVPMASAVAVAGVASLILRGTRLGRYIYAVGGNPEAAHLSGVPVRRVVTFAFAASGFCAGLAGIVYWARVSSGSHLAGDGYELYAIAAAVIGGTSLSGGRGRISGTVLGALMMAVLYNGLNVLGVQESAQKVVVGTVIVSAALTDRSHLRGRGPA